MWRQDNRKHEIKEIGHVKLDGNHKAKSLCEVLHVPTITKNLISIEHMVERGYQLKFNHKGCFIEYPRRNGYELIAKGKKEGCSLLIFSKGKATWQCSSRMGRRIGDLDLWHKMWGHINANTIIF